MAIIAGTPDPDRHPPAPERLYIAWGPESLRNVIDSHGLSVRELAALLGVSHMWVQRRARGQVEISEGDNKRIYDALAALHPPC